MPLDVKLVFFMKLNLTVVRFHILTATSNLVMIESKSEVPVKFKMLYEACLNSVKIKYENCVIAINFFLD